MCVLNMTIDISNPSRKCFDVVISWSVYGLPDNAKIVYYALTLLSLGGDTTFTRTNLNTSTLVISSDSLDSNREYLVNLEVHVQAMDSYVFLQRNSSVITPSCTGK